VRSMRKIALALGVIVSLVLLLPAHGTAQDTSIVVSSTTSTQDSGLFGHILPLFKQKTGIDVKVVAQGTGQALDTARRGDADVVFVHAKSAEEKFLAEGEGVKRYPVMYNDFILIGPKSDPAGIKGMKDVAKALQTIKEKQAPFISRGDRSGTHVAELALWTKDAGIDIEKDKGPWYKSVGQGMGAAQIPARRRSCRGMRATLPRTAALSFRAEIPPTPCGEAAIQARLRLAAVLA